MKKLALVLGGGAAKGFAHIGVLKVLNEYGIKPDIIIGTSMGAIVGGIYASGVCINKLDSLASKFSNKHISDFDLFKLISKGFLMRGKKLKEFIYQILKDTTHEDLAIPFTAIATELSTGKEFHLNKGLVWKNVLASSAMPSVFPSVLIDGKELCDGGITNNLPINVAKKQLPKGIILSVDVIGDYVKQVENGGFKLMTQILNMSTLYMTQQVTMRNEKADLNIKISQPEIRQMNFNKDKAIMAVENGENAMRKNINKLIKLLSE